MKRYIGIDLGTTNSTVSVGELTLYGDVSPKTLEVNQVDETGNNMRQEKILPSVLYVDQQNQPFVGLFARRMMGVFPQYTIKESKRYMGENVSWLINEIHYRPETAASYVLKILKSQAEVYYGGEKIDNVVITVPANFNFQQDQATRLAAELAGFDKDKIHTLPEPTAALIDFFNQERRLAQESRRLNLDGKPKKVMVFDLGGGTCDVSILQINEKSNGELDIQELSISQYTQLGGIDFDKKVMTYLSNKLLQEKKMTINFLKENVAEKDQICLWENLKDMAEKAKMSFSTRIENTLRNQGKDYYENEEQFDDLIFRQMLSNQLPEELIATLSITKKEYDRIVRPLLYESEAGNRPNIETPILNALKTARVPLTKDDIDAVFLVGGMTAYPTVLARIFEIFDRRIKPIKTDNPMEVVSRGAAVYHYYLDKINIKSAQELDLPISDGGIRDIAVTNTVPNNVYIEVFTGDPVPLLEKGTKVPFERIIEDGFYVSGPFGTSIVNSMKLDLFTASSPTSINTKKLASAEILFKKLVPVKSPLILKVACSEDREVSVKAWLKSDETEVLDVNIGAYRFTEQEKEAIRLQHQKVNRLRGE